MIQKLNEHHLRQLVFFADGGVYFVENFFTFLVKEMVVQNIPKNY
jgi:hypothetical protein